MVTPWSAFIKWSLIGSFMAGILVFAQASEVGGAAGLLQVGEFSDLRPMIEQQLGDLPLAKGSGHDGQIFYALGLDLTGDEVAPMLDHGAYRYRRILFPILASVGGILDGHALLYGMITVVVLSMGIAAGAVAGLAAHFEKSDWYALAVVLNPGAWLSVRLVTGDATALAATTVGLLAVVLGWRSASALFAASGLAKDVYLMTPAGLMIRDETRRWSLLVVPLGALVMWMTYLTITMGEGFTRRGNLAWPLQGVIQASSNWTPVDPGEVIYLIFALASVAVGLVHGLIRDTWLRWPILGWSVLAVISSNWVWDFGNNAARAFSPIVVLVAAAEANRNGVAGRR